ncbi:sex-lethal homolog isoform X5 [Condylostylus longicornis]|uniref:sex-lethal homolog isoform X5 n=1 Tax=Condylostylus longicornis TaxID=2530218 RepID=UPI00244E4880|nr:sex-lethal homolog isoform X5 [Condylostylus longicornis]XP_055380577.1 sex-lethal homolog isoform X5 [Condylostylus longicornis]
MYNSMNGYAPYRSSSGGRMWGMSHSLPSGMSRYAFSPQDTDFTSSYPAGAGFGGPGPGMFSGPQRSSRAMYNDFQANSALGQMGHMASSTSNLAGPGGGPLPVGCSGTNLIVNYLPQDMQDRELYSLFRTIGPINTCRIMRDLKTGYSFGYAFVDFCNETDAQRAIKSLNGITVRTKRLKVSYARPGGDCLKDTNLYVTNLPRTITEDQLDIIFGKYGQIVQKNILRDKLTGKPRGVAFVRFNKREEAQEAISALNNVIPEGGMQPLTVRVAEEHGKQKAHVYMGGGGGLQTPMYNNIMHRADRFTGLIDGIYRKKSYHYPFL